MTPTELQNWVCDYLWPQYKTLLLTPFATKWKAGDRGKAIAKIQTLNPSQQLRDDILNAITEHRIHRKKLWEMLGRSNTRYEEFTHFNPFYGNKMLSTWINNKCWLNEIPTLSEISQQINKPQNTEDKEEKRFVCILCNRAVKIKGHLCEICDAEYKKRDHDFHLQNIEKMGIQVKGKTKKEIVDQCKNLDIVKRYLGMTTRSQENDRNDSKTGENGMQSTFRFD